MNKQVQMGWMAPPIKDQFPELDSNTAEHFNRDSQELSRLKIRGIITHSEHQRAIIRFAKKLSLELKKSQKLVGEIK